MSDSDVPFAGLFPDALRREPASAQAIQRIEDNEQRPLPPWYREFLSFTDGLEGGLGEEGYLALWDCETVLSYQASEVGQFAPGLLLIGSNGGGEALAIDITSEKPCVVNVPFIGMSPDEVLPVAPDIVSLIRLATEDRLILPPD